MTKKKVLLAWSSGKDSAMALYRLKRDPLYEVAGLFTTFRESDDQISIHEVSLARAKNQADASGLPLYPIALPPQSPNVVYEERVAGALLPFKKKGITHLAFGDLFLHEIRQYREKHLGAVGFKLVFPLWGEPTKELANEIIQVGIRAVVVAIDPKVLPRTLIGKEFSQAFLDSLPLSVDPCGENGEFHTFVYASPDFSSSLSIDDATHKPHS